MALSLALYTQVNVSCNGLCNGYLSVLVTGGSGNYIYQWSNGGTTYAISNLCAGIYSLEVTDADTGSEVGQSYTITQPTSLTTSIEAESSNCFLGTGFLSAVSEGGTEPYTWLWSNGETTEGIDAERGIYSVTVTDANGCTATDTIDFLSGDFVYATVTGYADGHAIVHPSGGTPPYVYQWYTDPNQSGQTAYNLAAGTYQVLVADSNGCSYLAEVTIVDCDTLFLINANCCLAKIGNCWRIERSYGNDTDELQDNFENLKAWIDILRCRPEAKEVLTPACAVTTTEVGFQPIPDTLTMTVVLTRNATPVTVSGTFTSVLAANNAIQEALLADSGFAWEYEQISEYVFEWCTDYTLNGDVISIVLAVSSVSGVLGNITMDFTLSGGEAPATPVTTDCLTEEEYCTVINKIRAACKECEQLTDSDKSIEELESTSVEFREN